MTAPARLSRKRKLVFILVALGTVALLTEGGFRLAALVGAFTPTADESVANEWQWAKAHLDQGRATLESEMAFDAQLGWKLRPSLRTDALTTNSAGMRADREFPVEREPGRRRLLLVGDSFTFGTDVRDSETFAAILARGALRDWDVMNLAVPGYGTDQQVLMLEDVGLRYRPDVVILGFFVRDFSRNTLWFRSYAKPMFVPVPGDPDALQLTHVPVPSPEELFEEYRSGRRRAGQPFSSYAITFFRRSMREAWTRRFIEDTPEWQVLRRLMSRFQRAAAGAGALPVWLLIPNGDRLDDRTTRHARTEDLCEARARELHLACHRLAGPFVAWMSSHPGQEIYRPAEQGGHLSPTGNEVVAAEVAGLLGRLGVLRPNETATRPAPTLPR
jgi:hypothetical protein